MAELTAAGPVLVHFLDFAQLNSVRALPYAIAWDERYRDAGLATLGVHSPRFGFTSGRDTLAPALERLGIRHPVADDARYDVWHDYGCKGWPSLFLWGQGGALRWFHFGEGEYSATEAAIVDELRATDPRFSPPPPLEPLRPSDAAGRARRPAERGGLPRRLADRALAAAPRARPLELRYEAGGAHASIDGEGELRFSLDGVQQTVTVAGPGLYDLAVHPRHERHALTLAASPGVDVYSVSFSAGLP